MHEYGLTESILRKSLEIAHAHGQLPIEKIVLKIGPLQQIVQESMHFAFEVMREDTLAAQAVLEIESVPVTIHCPECHGDYEPVDPVFWTCPTCDAPGGQVISGNELLIQSVILNDDI